MSLNIPSTYLVGFFVVIAIVGLGAYAIYPLVRPAPIRRLLEGEGHITHETPKNRDFLPQIKIKKLKTLLGLDRDKRKLGEYKKLLTQAGYYGERALNQFLFWKLVSPLLGLLIGLVLVLILKLSLWAKSVLIYMVLAGGFYLPNFIIKEKIKSRQKTISSSLADALDLLVVCVEAGLGLNAALKRVADDFRLSNPVLSHEFNLVNLEIAAGLEREQALRNLAERTGVDDIGSLVAVLIQADRFGTSIATALRVQSDTMRTKRRQKLEEKAAQTPVKLIFPLLLFIFPALMVVIMGPAIIQMMEQMLKK